MKLIYKGEDPKIPNNHLMEVTGKIPGSLNGINTEFSGSATIWRDVKTGKRPEHSLESRLAAELWRIRRDAQIDRGAEQ